MKERDDLIQEIRDAEKTCPTYLNIYGAIYEVCSLPELEMILEYLKEK